MRVPLVPSLPEDGLHQSGGVVDAEGERPRGDVGQKPQCECQILPGLQQGGELGLRRSLPT